MPTYQYACTSCGEQLEAVQRFTDDPLTVCPACGGALRKVFSPVGIVFKGSGFYRTDSRNGSVPGGGKDKDKDKDKSKDSESKPAAKSNGSGDSPKSKESSSGSGSSGSPDGKKPAETKSQPAKATSSA